MTIDWSVVASKVAEGVAALAPIAEVAVPEAAPAIAIITKIISGVAAAEPVAVALLKQIQSGTPPTSAQLAQYYMNYKTDDDALKADIEAHLKGQ